MKCFDCFYFENDHCVAKNIPRSHLDEVCENFAWKVVPYKPEPKFSNWEPSWRGDN